MTDKTENQASQQVKENAQRQVEQDKKAAEQSRAEYAEASKGKPTPTQEENDLAMHGGFETGSEHEADGSETEEARADRQAQQRHQSRQAEANKTPNKPGQYQTRAATASGVNKPSE